MRALIISGGKIEKNFALNYIKEYDPEYIVAADRGLLFCLENHMKVDMVVGDFDSAPDGVLEAYRKEYHVPVRAFNPIKDYTDTEIAIRQIIKAGATKAVLLGCTGTRLDHVMGNLQCLHILLDAGVNAQIVDMHNRISLHDKLFIVKKEERFGPYISFLPACEEMHLTLKGFKYPLTDHLVTNKDSLCVSNEITADTAEVIFHEGRLFMIESRD